MNITRMNHYLVRWIDQKGTHESVQVALGIRRKMEQGDYTHIVAYSLGNFFEHPSPVRLWYDRKTGKLSIFDDFGRFLEAVQRAPIGKEAA